MKKLIIIRGRPGAGKSTIAKQTQRKLLPQKVAILCPDYFYWQVFPGEENQHLVNQILNFTAQKYLENNYIVILEGILPKSENDELFKQLKNYCQKEKIDFYSFFIEVSQDRALERNDKRKKGKKISKEDMKQWYQNVKPKEIDNEILIQTDQVPIGKIVEKILRIIKT